MEELSCYQIATIPDAGDPVNRAIAGGDVAHAIRECNEHLLRTLVTYPDRSATLALRWVFTPAPSPAKRQTRLTIALMARARDANLARNLRVLIECSDLRTYYGLQYGRPPRELPTPYGASCDITRVEQSVQPLHSADSNPAIPPLYYLCHAFSPRSSNDYLLLDRVLDRIGEPVMLEVAVEPVDLSAEQFLHTRSIAQLQSINRAHESDAEDDQLAVDPFEPGAYPRSADLTVIKPLRRRDPIADDILRQRRRFHETLGTPHLRFHLRALAQTPAVAQLMASVVAESAFEEGSYALWPCDFDSECFRKAQISATRGAVFAQPTLDRVFGEHAAAYGGFAMLGHVATVDELLSAFAMPVAGRGQLRCLRKSTEPASVPMEDLLILGHDD